MSFKDLILYSYHYSSASWRVRAVLALKKIPFKYETVHLLQGAQHSDEYVKLNSMHQVPSLKVTDGEGNSHIITQSLTIINFLEENYPDMPIYPKDPIKRAKSQAIADTISSGIQPLQNLETLVDYVKPLGQPNLSAEDRKKVAQFWITRKLDSLEVMVKLTAGKYCVGDEITVADVCLVPQMFNARRFEIDTTRYPTLKSIDDLLQQQEIFKVSHPTSCPDFPKQ